MATTPELLAAVRAHGTPVFVLDARRLAENQKRFLQSAQARFEKVAVCYSVKTNAHPEVLKRIESGFEAASVHEMQSAGAAERFSVYNSPAKTVPAIRTAFESGYVPVADSLEELDKTGAAAKTARVPNPRIGLRLQGAMKKFGIPGTRMGAAYKKAKSLGLEPVLFHAHPGTRQTPAQYESFLRQTKKHVPAWAAHVDLGGGFPSQAAMDEKKWTLDDYLGPAQKILGPALKGKTVVFEPGRHLVEDAITLVTRVVATKTVDKNPYAVCDAGINVLGRLSLSHYAFSPLDEPRKGKTELVGPTLFGNDNLGSVPFALDENDLLAVSNAGAYSHALAWELSYPKPPLAVTG